MTDRIEARYWIETAYPLEVAANTMAGEQSTGTFVRVAGETDELREQFAARRGVAPRDYRKTFDRTAS